VHCIVGSDFRVSFHCTLYRNCVLTRAEIGRTSAIEANAERSPKESPTSAVLLYKSLHVHVFECGLISEN